MSSVNILNIIPKNPVTKFTEPYSFEIILEILSELKKDIEMKMVYITSQNEKEDQILGEIQIEPPNQLGKMKFQFDGECPKVNLIPENDVVGVAAILLCCSYNGQEFFRCGYYLNVTYDNEEMNINRPEKVDVNHLVRNLLADKPRIVRYEIDWEGENGKNMNKNDAAGQFMFNDGKMNQDKFKSLEMEKGNNNF